MEAITNMLDDNMKEKAQLLERAGINNKNNGLLKLLAATGGNLDRIRLEIDDGFEKREKDMAKLNEKFCQLGATEADMKLNCERPEDLAKMMVVITSNFDSFGKKFFNRNMQEEKFNKKMYHLAKVVDKDQIILLNRREEQRPDLEAFSIALKLINKIEQAQKLGL